MGVIRGNGKERQGLSGKAVYATGEIIRFFMVAGAVRLRSVHDRRALSVIIRLSVKIRKRFCIGIGRRVCKINDRYIRQVGLFSTGGLDKLRYSSLLIVGTDG